MFVFANLFLAIAKVLDTVLTLYTYVLIVRALISWFSPDPYNPLVQMLYRITEPVLDQVRKVVPSIGGLDLSIIITVILIQFLQSFLIKTLVQIARSF